MRLVVERSSLKRNLVWLQWVLFALAVPVLGYCLLAGFEAWMFQQRARLELDRQVAAQKAEPKAPVARIPAELAVDALIGRIEVPRLGLSAMIAEGTGSGTLGHAVGHIVRTAMPGEAGGNIGLAGHRDTFFRPLQGIRQNDLVVLSTTAGVYRYLVVSMRVVPPTEISVLDPLPGQEILTLVTCHPFAFIGSAPNRFIVRAERTP